MKILNIIKYDILKMTREKGTLILTFLMPVMLILIFGNLNFGDGNNDPKFPVGLTNYDTGSASADLVNEIKKDKTIYIIDLNEDELYSQVKNSDITVGFIIPKDYSDVIIKGSQPKVEVVKLPSSSDYPVIEGIVNTAYAKLNAKNSIVKFFDGKMGKVAPGTKELELKEIGLNVEEYLQKPFLATVESKTHLQKVVKKIDMKATYTLSFSIVFVMWAVVFAAGEVLIERKINTWERINLTPTKKSTIFIGKILGTFIRGWIQVAFLIVFSKLIMGIDWGNSMAMTLVVVSVFLLCVTSFGMFMSAIVKSFSQLAAMSAIIITCSSMLAGCYWPLDMMPDTMQKLAKIFPQYWALKGLSANLENLGIKSLVEPILVLSFMGVLFFLGSLVISRLKIKARKKVSLGVPIENTI